MDREGLDVLVCEYLSRGGEVLKVPAAVPATPAGVLEYLSTVGLKVDRVVRSSSNNSVKYRHNGELLTWPELVQLANGYRREQQLPPFEAQ